MSTYMSIEEIRENYYNGEYRHKMHIPEKVYINHVFDENLSVKQNREMAIEHNKMVDDMHVERTKKSRELLLKLRKDVSTYIANEYDMSENQACIVEDYVYNKEHALMCDYFVVIDEAAQMVANVLNAR